jgi:hypothetical protein
MGSCKAAAERVFNCRLNDFYKKRKSVNFDFYRLVIGKETAFLSMHTPSLLCLLLLASFSDKPFFLLRKSRKIKSYK